MYPTLVWSGLTKQADMKSTFQVMVTGKQNNTSMPFWRKSPVLLVPDDDGGCHSLSYKTPIASGLGAEIKGWKRAMHTTASSHPKDGNIEVYMALNRKPPRGKHRHRRGCLG